MVQISLVVAVAENGIIGSLGDMPWQLSTDLKRFKEVTLGKPMIMGRKTFEAIGRPLPGRTSIIVTRDKTWQSEGVVPVQNIESAILLATEVAQSSGQTEICVVGGGEIYKQTIGQADILHFTRVHASPEGDTKFPDISLQDWDEIDTKHVEAGERDSVATTYYHYRRKS